MGHRTVYLLIDMEEDVKKGIPLAEIKNSAKRGVNTFLMENANELGDYYDEEVYQEKEIEQLKTVKEKMLNLQKGTKTVTRYFKEKIERSIKSGVGPDAYSSRMYGELVDECLCTETVLYNISKGNYSVPEKDENYFVMSAEVHS